MFHRNLQTQTSQHTVLILTRAIDISQSKIVFEAQMRRIALLLLALMMSPLILSVFAGTSSVAADVDGTPFRIRYTATLKNVNSEMDRVVVYLPVPREWDSQKSVQIESFYPQPNSITEDPDYGNKMAYFLLPSGIPSNQSREFTIQYTFTFYETHIQVDPARVGAYNASDPTYVEYSKQRPADHVESDYPTIKKAASDIVGTETNPYLKAKLIYNWVVANIRYEFPAPWGALETYQKRAGDCGMYTALFCAMAISQGIPCRAVSGLFFEPPFPRTYSSKGSPTDPGAYGCHVYAEFYLPNYGWIPADASIGRGSGKPDAYFGHTHDPFLISSKGFGIQLVPPVRGVKNLWVFQQYVWWFWGEARKYDSYYTYRVERAQTAQTTATETATSVAVSYTRLT